MDRNPDIQSDPSAFHHELRRLTALARRVVSTAATAEEVAADALVRLSASPVRLRPAGEVAAWLNRVTINEALNRVRSERRHTARVLAQGSSAASPVADTPEEAVTRADEQHRVRQVLTNLPERQAVTLLLRHAGHSYAEIADSLGVAEGSVGVLLARGERAFRREWTARIQGEDPR